MGVLFPKKKDFLSQEEFFVKVIKNLTHSRGPMWLKGYDKSFFELKKVHEGLVDRLNKGDAFHAILSIQYQSKNPLQYLEKDSELGGVTFHFLNQEIDKGYFVVSKHFLYFWNSNKLTKHPEERKEGIIRRESFLYQPRLLEKAVDGFSRDLCNIENTSWLKSL